MSEESFDRARDFVIEAATSGRELGAEWRLSLQDVARDLDKIRYEHAGHPDLVDAVEEAMSALAGAWLTDEERNRLYLGTLEQPDRSET